MQKEEEKMIWAKKMSRKLRVQICCAEGFAMGSFPGHYNTLVQIRIPIPEKKHQGNIVIG
jgi:hypothetical protein